MEYASVYCTNPDTPVATVFLLSRDDVNARRAEGSVVRASEAWTCAYFVLVGATEPKPKKSRDTNDRSGD